MGIVVAIDGPAGSGKSSTAKEVAKRLGFTYVDTGAMYRAITLLAIRRKVNPEVSEQIISLASSTDIRFRWENGDLRTLLNGEDVSEEIRSAEVAQAVSPVSAIAGVREIMVKRQREMSHENNIVMEGRDIGTNVFPRADFKFYVTADVEVRARRRIGDYQKIGQNLSLEEIIKEIKKRDRIDSSRAHSPLKKADDAIVIDTTHLTFEEQVEKIIEIVKNRPEMVR
ncbi:MAG: cytidylate kinase [Candidatus Marinimicrobia bacterium CG08_land_8_20_14_0_20_45_22]|nr:MAG: cytidylate kinase [Candidatus Marinimicrobia bacterium CG08_land_8_20_14_0_20_45_22]